MTGKRSLGIAEANRDSVTLQGHTIPSPSLVNLVPEESREPNERILFGISGRHSKTNDVTIFKNRRDSKTKL